MKTNIIREFENDKFGKVRAIIDDNDQIYFVGTDIINALGLTNAARTIAINCKSPVRKNIEVKTKNKTKMRIAPNVTMINSSDIHCLVTKSKLLNANEFEKWILNAVIPAIKTPNIKEKEREAINYYFSGLSQELQGKIVEELVIKNKELQKIYDDLINTDDLMTINVMAKELGIGEYKLFKFLRTNRVLFYDKNKVNVPYERFRRENKFVVKETYCHDGQLRPITYVTKKGLDYVRKLLWKKGYYNISVNM